MRQGAIVITNTENILISLSKFLNFCGKRTITTSAPKNLTIARCCIDNTNSITDPTNQVGIILYLTNTQYGNHWLS